MFKTIHSHQHHLGWNRRQEPAIQVTPGETLELELLDASGNRIDKKSPHSIINTLKPENANPLTGPVYVEGASPGDVLVVDILEFHLGHWGWTALIPGFGLLAEEFSEPFLHISEYNAQSIFFTDDIILSTRPFAGTIWVCPDVEETLGAIPPHHCGGNLDLKTLTAGTRLYFPVEVPGALFSAGDGHAAQGHGEVCGTAIETRLTIRAAFSLQKDSRLPFPKAEIPAAPSTGPAHVTSGIGPDLHAAARDAVRFMIDELTARYRLSPELAYCLCSTAADLSIAQLVNAPNWTVVCTLPEIQP